VPVRSIGWSPPVFYEGVVDGSGGAWGTVGFVWLFGSFWNGVLSVFVYAIYYSPWRVRRLYRSGTPVIGRVIGKRFSRASKSIRHYVRYAYQTLEGQALEGEVGVGVKEHDSVAAGSPVTVLYDPRKAKRSVVYELGPHVCE
jgi:hypothetical protein